MRLLPVTISFGRPSRPELLLVAGALLLLGSASGWLVWATRSAPPPPTPVAWTVPLTVSSTPSGATVLVDDRPRGLTPAVVDIAPGPHVVSLQAPDAITETHRIDVAADDAHLDVALWRAHPAVQYLKPALPGAALVDARFLDDGRVGLVLELPGGEHQGWSLDPDRRFATQRLGDVAPRSTVAIRPNGQQLAYLLPREPSADAPHGTLEQGRDATVWLAPAAGAGEPPQRDWSLPEGDEELVDLVWAPDGQHMLLVGRQHPGQGSARTSLRWLDSTTGDAPLLALLPSEVAPGSTAWRADGRAVAFVVHTASLTAVSTLDEVGDFRYLGDLGHDGLAGPPVAPVAWGPDGRVAYSAIRPQDASAGGNVLGFSTPVVGLFLADATASPGRPVAGDTGLAPFWRPDGRLFVAGLGTERTSGLHLRALDDQSQVIDVATLDVPTPTTAGYGLRWDVSRQRALLVTNQAAASGSHDFFLLDFGWDAAS